MSHVIPLPSGLDNNILIIPTERIKHHGIPTRHRPRRLIIIHRNARDMILIRRSAIRDA